MHSKMKTVRILPRLLQKFPGMKYEIIFLMDRSWYCKMIMTESCHGKYYAHIIYTILHTYLQYRLSMYTLQGINISHLRKRKIIFKMPFLRGYVSSLEGHNTRWFQKNTPFNGLPTASWNSRRWGLGLTAPQHSSRTARGWGDFSRPKATQGFCSPMGNPQLTLR